MKFYTVGGYVRDTLLNREPNDQDYVIVGATSDDVEQLVSLGFKQVGADFPVFLCPKTGNEYALARTERKVGVGYKGFETYTSADLTIEDDLLRRDFTMNAMAFDSFGNLIDPYGGMNDLLDGIIRHVSDAFAEDPLRVLRAARFAARFGFSIHSSTKNLMVRLVTQGELDHLSRERVWVELEKILNSEFAFEGIKILRDVGALQRLFHPNFGGIISFLTAKKFNSINPIAKFTLLSGLCNFSKEDMYRFKAPVDFINGVFMLYHMFDGLDNWKNLDDQDVVKKLDIVEELGFLGNLKTFENTRAAFSLTIPNWETIEREIRDIADVAKTVDCAAIASRHKNGKDIALAIHNARLNAIQNKEK
jgi:hypothetical protein